MRGRLKNGKLVRDPNVEDPPYGRPIRPRSVAALAQDELRRLWICGEFGVMNGGLDATAHEGPF